MRWKDQSRKYEVVVESCDAGLQSRSGLEMNLSRTGFRSCCRLGALGVSLHLRKPLIQHVDEFCSNRICEFRFEFADALTNERTWFFLTFKK